MTGISIQLRRFGSAQGPSLLLGLVLALASGKVAAEGEERGGAAVSGTPASEPVAPVSSPVEPIGSELVPPPVASDDFSALRTGSPFLRVLDPAEKYVLRAVASLNDIQIATLQDRATKKTILVTPEKENEQGLKLVEIVPGQDLEGVMAKITFAGQEVEFKYDSSQIFPTGSSVGGKTKAPSKGGEERKGPSKEDIDRYKSLSDESRNKLRGYISHVMKSYPNLSREERGNMIRGAMIRLSDGRDLDYTPVEPNKQ